MSASNALPGDLLTEVLEEDDDSTLPVQTPSCETLIVQQYIVYSPTFQVPAFYFTVHDKSTLLCLSFSGYTHSFHVSSDGSPLPLRDIIGTTLFHSHVLPRCANTAPHGISMPGSNFPLLSQGDHPVLGTAAWYLHPCETSVAVTELLDAAVDGYERASDKSLLHLMESWFLILCSVVDLRWVS
jgi:ubiquitin-like-conjugating enzyme ATG10